MTLSCSLWEYDDPSNPLEQKTPETYLSLIATDTIYAYQDTVTGEWHYDLGNIPDTTQILDTLKNAFTDTFTSRHELHWWGEDSDGEVMGYQYRWNVDTVWSFTMEESGIFYVPIRTSFDVFRFEIAALDNDSLFDPTPSNVVFPVKNSPPSVSFRYLSNPQIVDIRGDTAFTFPTRTFIWDLDDQDGVETITNIFFALDETCDTCWIQLGAESSVTLNETELDPGFHTFYLKVQDIAGAESFIISFPDTLNEDEPNFWKVMPVVGNVLLVDDYPLDGDNNAQMWFKTVLDSIVGGDNYSVWEIGDELPFSSTDITANLNYFDHVIWHAANDNTADLSDTFRDAEANILNYIMNGGNLFLNARDWDDDSTFAFFPIDSSFIINQNGWLMQGKELNAQVNSELIPDLDLEISFFISHRVKGFILESGDTTETGDPSEYPFFGGNDLYHLQEPEDSWDAWTGTPNVCSMGKFLISPSQESGKIVLMSIPLHNGWYPTLEGNGSAGKFIEYLLNEVFVE
jgi:hypothetical protein